MSNAPQYRIAVLPGDGIGVEVTRASLEVLREAQRLVGGYALDFTELPAGAFCYKETGEALPKATVDEAAKSDAILLGACGWPEIRYPDGTEIRPQVELRFILDLYAGVRPIRYYPGTPQVLANSGARPIDFILIRESTEGLFASRGTMRNDAAAGETLLITRHTTERLMRYGYQLARSRKAKGHPGRLTCVDKANVFSAFAFYRSIYDEVGLEFTDVEKDYCYVDAMALNMVRKPWDYDVMVMENMFGDILSDLGAGLIGGMGMAPSGDIGDEHAVFQPSHGTAPDIAGKGLANPVAMVLSAAMLCDHLAEKRGNAALGRTARLIEHGVEAYLASGQGLPGDLGGQAGTSAIVEGILAAMEAHGAQ
ncbi:MAG TPA: isocitrate/isopropylmalate family dehydrogenase [bacterium]|nr:isocitrate/isopropylmalate family dehydrogenase [bacterium]